jgi:hypothetical protein
MQMQALYKLSNYWTSQTVLSKSSTKTNGYYQYLWDSANGDEFTRYISKADGTFYTTDIQQNFIGDFKIGNMRNRLVAGLDYYNSRLINGGSGWVTNGTVSLVNGTDTGILTQAGTDALLTGSFAGNTEANQEIMSAYVSDVINVTNKLSVMASLRLDYFDGKTSQYDGVAYNSGLASGEDFNNQNFGYFDAGAGILYTYAKKVKAMAKNANKRVNVGLAAYHITRPNNSFIELASEKLPVRYTAFANADISIDGTDGDILPGVYYQRQGTFSQLLFGSYYKYKFNNGSNYTGFERPFAVSLGIFTRLKDSYIAKLMIDWDQFSLGYAYDFTISSLTLNSNRFGASEIFLRFNVGDGGGFRYNRK